jgi:uncharacterized protein involved in exopolysaccharide biosynthesis
MTTPPPDPRAIEPRAAGDAPSLLDLTAALIRRWRLIVVAGLAGAAIAAAWSLLATPRYRASARFALEERRGLTSGSGLAALAGQLGAGGLSGVRSLQFYAEVMTSRDILEQVAVDSFAHPETGARAPLMDILEIPGDTERERLHATLERLHRQGATSTNDRTGTITLNVLLPDPELAAAVAARIYELLERFNFETRRSAATERREFAARELERARRELTDAEADLRSFLERNRGGLEIPRLAFEQQRRERLIDIRAETYNRLATELEEAKIEEVRDTPVFTLIEAPKPPVYREFPRRTWMTMVGGVLGGAAAVAWIILGAATRSASRLSPDSYETLRSAVRGRPA